MHNKRILLVVSGSIAAYKACSLARALTRAQNTVDIVMSEAATQFVSPRTFEALTQRHVCVSQFDDCKFTSPHIALTQDVDAICVYPASANTIAKMAHGIADNLVSSTLVAAEPSKTILFPAMNPRMYAQASMQSNIETLKSRGVLVVGPISDTVADGERGIGHVFPEKQALDIIEAFCAFEKRLDLSDKTVLLTAGATREPLDPVRFVSNNSSGKMALALVNALLAAKATPVVVAGYVDVEFPDTVAVIPALSAQEMLQACEREADAADAFIGVAAVSDQRPESVATEKLKKGKTLPKTLAFLENPDIFKTLTSHFKHLVSVAFAAETEDVIKAGREKMDKKGADFLVACDLSEKTDSGFGGDRIRATLLSKDFAETDALQTFEKTELAQAVVSALSEKLGGAR